MSDARLRLRSDCSVGEECPALDRRRDGWVEVTGYLLDDSGRRDHADTEAVVEVPDRMLREIVDLAVVDLGGFIGARHRTDLLRVQTLDRYGVPSDGDDFHRYLAGAELPTSPAKQAWLDKLRADADRGRIRRNVHIVREPLTDYLCYQFEWGYAYNVEAGQDIRVLSVEQAPAAARVIDVGDFTVVERKDVVHSRYGADGSFAGAVQAGSDVAGGYAALAELVWELATPFTGWWERHPQYHRATRAA